MAPPSSRGLRAIALGVLILVAVPAVAYVTIGALRSSSIFAVDTVEVGGARGPVAEQVEQEARRATLGDSLLAVSSSQLARRLEQIPTVHAIAVDRDFPSTVRIAVVPEHAVALGRLHDARLLLSATGRVIGDLGEDGKSSLPRVWLTGDRTPVPGERLTDRDALAELSALAALPARFPAPVGHAKTDERGLYLELRGGPDVRLGPPFDLRAKLEVAALLLDRVGYAGGTIEYVDVSAPERPAVRPAGGDPATILLAQQAADAAAAAEQAQLDAAAAEQTEAVEQAGADATAEATDGTGTDAESDASTSSETPVEGESTTPAETTSSDDTSTAP